MIVTTARGDSPARDAVLVHLGAGIGNIVLATPLLVVLARAGFAVDVWLSADYAETADLLREWAVVRRLVSRPDLDRYDAVLPAVPPFYWRRFAPVYRGCARLVARPPDALFYENEQAFYLAFARSLGCDAPAPFPMLPVAPPERFAGMARSVVLAPGCKTGEMAAKRWPWYGELASRFDEVSIVGTRDDLRLFDGRPMTFPPRARSFAGRLSLRETAEMLASARVVVANDAGLGHVAAALGTPAILLFGPTPDRALGPLPPSAVVVRTGMACEPCWFNGRFERCARRIDCLRRLEVDRVVSEMEKAAGA